MPRNSFNLSEANKYRIKYTYYENGRKQKGSTLVIALDETAARDILSNRLVAVGELEILEVRLES